MIVAKYRSFFNRKLIVKIVKKGRDYSVVRKGKTFGPFESFQAAENLVHSKGNFRKIS